MKLTLLSNILPRLGHPGNILVMNSKADIGLLDFGQTKRFSEQNRLGFAKLVDAMSKRNSDEISSSLRNLGIFVEHIPQKQSKCLRESKYLTPEQKLTGTMFDTAKVPGVSEDPFSETSALRFGSVSSFPKELFFLLRTMQILRGICSATSNADYSIIDSWAHLARAELRKSPQVQQNVGRQKF